LCRHKATVPALHLSPLFETPCYYVYTTRPGIKEHMATKERGKAFTMCCQ
jgi:hypothetical protein